jgi:hypothetical protein
METETGTFFESGSARPFEQGREMLELVSAETGKLRYELLIEGHAAARWVAPGASYSNWVLSADRANSARRIMEVGGIEAYLEEVLRTTGKRITKTDIWQKARYTSRSEFERWQRCDRRATKTAHQRFCRILSEKPHLS